MRRFYKSLQYAGRGLKTVYTTERNFRLHVLFALLAILAAIYFRLNWYLWLIILIIIGMVLSLEIINSAIERLVDMLAPRTHHFAKEIKDLLAAMVLVACFFALLAGLIIFVFK